MNIDKLDENIEFGDLINSCSTLKNAYNECINDLNFDLFSIWSYKKSMIPEFIWFPDDTEIFQLENNNEIKVDLINNFNNGFYLILIGKINGNFAFYDYSNNYLYEVEKCQINRLFSKTPISLKNPEFCELKKSLKTMEDTDITKYRLHINEINNTK